MLVQGKKHMLYDEFVRGTGCRETSKNYQIYKELENIYMNGDLSKEEIYAIGKMRVDNSLTEEEQEIIADREQRIASAKEQIEYYTTYTYYGTWQEVQEWHKRHIETIKSYKDEIKMYNDEIKEIKSRCNA